MRVMGLVAAQRAEHRKAQRLSLDTSGHRQSLYADMLAQGTATAAVAAANRAATAAGLQPDEEDAAQLGWLPSTRASGRQASARRARTWHASTCTGAPLLPAGLCPAPSTYPACPPWAASPHC